MAAVEDISGLGFCIETSRRLSRADGLGVARKVAEVVVPVGRVMLHGASSVVELGSREGLRARSSHRRKPVKATPQVGPHASALQSPPGVTEGTEPPKERRTIASWRGGR